MWRFEDFKDTPAAHFCMPAILSHRLLVGVFTVGISIARFVNEFFREPDAHLAYVVAETGLSRGQWLTIPMIAIGLAVIAYSLTRTPKYPAPGEAKAA